MLEFGFAINLLHDLHEFQDHGGGHEPGLDPSVSLDGCGLLRYLEATAQLLAAKLGDLEGKLGYREVMLKLSWAMLCHVEAICQIWFGHVVGFSSRYALPPAGQDFKWVSARGVGSIQGSKYGYLVAMLALLGPSWDQLRPSRGPWWCYVGSVRGYNSGIAKNHPKLYLQIAFPHGPRGVTE